MTNLTDLGDFLEDMGLGAQTGNPPTLYLGSMPDSPDTLLVLRQYPGDMPEYVQDSFTPTTERPQIQVVARAVRFQDAELLAYRAWIALSAINNSTLSGTYYRSVRPNGSPGLLARDTNDRLLVYFNATVEKEVSVVVPS